MDTTQHIDLYFFSFFAAYLHCRRFALKGAKRPYPVKRLALGSLSMRITQMMWKVSAVMKLRGFSIRRLS